MATAICVRSDHLLVRDAICPKCRAMRTWLSTARMFICPNCVCEVETNTVKPKQTTLETMEVRQ
jgi:acetone carboxylase gamma subunit